MFTNKNELLWASGLFEGEGWISIQRFCPAMGIQLCDRDVLERFQTAVGCGNIYLRKVRPYNESQRIFSRKEQWAWRVTGFQNVQAVLAYLWAGLGTRRRTRAREVLNRAKLGRIKKGWPPRKPSVASCGDVRKYWNGCRCGECKQANALYQKELGARHKRELPNLNRAYSRKTPE